MTRSMYGTIKIGWKMSRQPKETNPNIPQKIKRSHYYNHLAKQIEFKKEG